MVNATEQLDQLAALADDDKPPDSGYSHHEPIERQDFAASSSPRGVPHIAAADKDAAAELNPAGKQESLTARLLHTIAPATGGRPINRSSSLPNLERRRQQQHSNATSPHGNTGIAYEQHPDDAASFVSVEKAQRVHTFTGALPSEKASTPVLAGILTNNNGGGGNGHPPNATPEDGSTTPGPRPPLLSKKLLEPKKPLGKNPTFRQCLINVSRYSWLNVLFVFVPVRYLATAHLE